MKEEEEAAEGEQASKKEGRGRRRRRGKGEKGAKRVEGDETRRYEEALLCASLVHERSMRMFGGGGRRETGSRGAG